MDSQREAGKSAKLRARVRFLPLRTHIAHRRDDLKQTNHAWMGELTQDLHFPYCRNRKLAQRQCVQASTHSTIGSDVKTVLRTDYRGIMRVSHFDGAKQIGIHVKMHEALNPEAPAVTVVNNMEGGSQKTYGHTFGYGGAAATTPVLRCPHSFFFLPNLRSNRQLEPPLPLNFYCRIFRNTALAPNFSINPLFGKADMGSLVHSSECGKSTAVFVTSFHPDVVAEI